MIQRMQKVLFVGPESKKENFLKKLQKAGVLQIDDYTGSKFNKSDNFVDTAKTDRIVQSWKLLKQYQTLADNIMHHNNKTDDISAVVDDVLAIERELGDLYDEQKSLESKIAMIEPLGNFDLDVIRNIENLSSSIIQFWEVSEKNYSRLDIPKKAFVIEVQNRGGRIYFITIYHKTLQIDKTSEIVITESLKELQYQLVNNERKQSEFKNKLIDFTVYLDDIHLLYLSELNELNYKKALGAMITPLDGMLFALQGWTSKEDLDSLRKLSGNNEAELIEIEPDKGEKEPTLLKNKGLGEMGQDLVLFYDTPSSKEWDPSTWVFLSFIVFFAMIMGDGGYGITLFSLLLFFRIRNRKASASTKRFLNMGMVLTFATFIYGALFDNIYGVNFFIPKGLSFPEFMLPAVEWINNFKGLESAQKNSALMKTSVLIGMVHISLSLILKVLRDFSNRVFIKPLSNIAWIAIIWAFYFWYSSGAQTSGLLQTTPGLVLTAGLGIVFLTSAGTLHPGKLIVGGLGGIYNGVQFFSDVLSYIRIFALGLSGSLIAVVFNDLAGMVFNSGMNIFLAGLLGALILIFGHLLNIGLCLMGAVIHGLRLNFLEYYRWSFDGDGRPFKPFSDLLLRGVAAKNQ
ncbi:MAG: hypothetical protein JXK07_10615 [Spirochaetes bacterium]|nr:hypothetical protein [Spirochaetota bacterium]MBN2769282.1 hypothetical protein [Spirochaetota bacterium]